jgi:hypothetical protein
VESAALFVSALATLSSRPPARQILRDDAKYGAPIHDGVIKFVQDKANG